MGNRKTDALDRLVLFLAKRDGIDKLVKTFQYVSKIMHYKLENSRPDLANRAKSFEVACGLSRKAFRTGRFLTGFNAIRASDYPDWKVTILNILGNGGEMIYFLFDHLNWMSKVGLIEAAHGAKYSYISSSGEAFGYIFFMAADILVIKRGVAEEKEISHVLDKLMETEATIFKPLLTASTILTEDTGEQKSKVLSCDDACSTAGKGVQGLSVTQGIVKYNAVSQVTGQQSKADSHSLKNQCCAVGSSNLEKISQLKADINRIRTERLMCYMSLAAQIADFLIAIADIEPNPVCNHPITLGICGLVSAWAGWFRGWPAT